MSFNGIKIDNGTSTLEENNEMNIVKINFPTTHTFDISHPNIKEKIKEQREIWENREYGGNIPNT